MNDFEREVNRLMAKAQKAAEDENWRVCMLACLDLCELFREHFGELAPEEEQFIENFIERVEKQLGMRTDGRPRIAH